VKGPSMAGRAFPRALLLGLALLWVPIAGLSQVVPDTIPPPPDTIPPGADTIPPPPDTLPPGADTLPPPPDSLARERMEPDSMMVDPQEVDSLAADSISPADTLPAVELPGLARTLPTGFETGVWSWDRDAILGSKAVTLAELVAQVPGTVPLRGGDYGTPVSVSAFGVGGERIRVFMDGVELLPLEGSTPDLARVGLGGMRSVRVIRGVGELRMELESMWTEGGRPYSFIEAGTGDLNTNLFRGTFSHPRALGGVLAFAMDRVDTQGPFGREPGSATGGWLKYARGIGSRGSVSLSYSRRSSNRGDLFVPESAGRTDWSIRTRWVLPKGLVGDLFYASSRLNTDEEVGFEFEPEARTRLGAILSYESPWIRGLTRVQRISGEGVPGKSAFLELSASHQDWGGIAGEGEWEDWDGETVSRTRFRAWTAPLWGLSLFAEGGSGRWGLPYLPSPAPEDPEDPGGEDPGQTEPEEPGEPEPPVLPGPRFTDTEGTRFGLSYGWRGFRFSGARLSVTTDSLFLLGLPTDRTGVLVDDVFLPSSTLPGGTRDGFEVSGRIPLYPSGFALTGSLQWWDQPEDPWTTPGDSLASQEPLPAQDQPWRYLPRRNYQAALNFHDTFFPTGNLEVWFDLGVAGRDPMVVPFLETVEVGGEETSIPTAVPFYQNWFVRLQIRVVTVRVFFMWENFATRQRNQDFPGRVLIPSRSLYGVRWTMWN